MILSSGEDSTLSYLNIETEEQEIFTTPDAFRSVPHTHSSHFSSWRDILEQCCVYCLNILLLCAHFHLHTCHSVSKLTVCMIDVLICTYMCVCGGGGGGGVTL